MRSRLDLKLFRLLDAILSLTGRRLAPELLLALLERSGTLTGICGGSIRGWSHRVGCGHRGRDGVADEAARGIWKDGGAGVERRVAGELVKGVAGIVRERAAVPER